MKREVQLPDGKSTRFSIENLANLLEDLNPTDRYKLLIHTVKFDRAEMGQVNLRGEPTEIAAILLRRAEKDPQKLEALKANIETLFPQQKS